MWVLSRAGRILSAPERDLGTIVNVEVDFIKKRKKFASLDELVSRGDLGRHMLGRFGYVYSICLSGKSINASAFPSPSEMLPAVHVTFFGPGLDPIIASIYLICHSYVSSALASFSICFVNS